MPEVLLEFLSASIVDLGLRRTIRKSEELQIAVTAKGGQQTFIAMMEQLALSSSMLCSKPV